MNKTLQGQRAFPGSLKRIKLWGLCTSQCVNNKPAVDALKKQNSWCFPYLERASPSLLRRFKYFICEVRYKGRYELPPPAASEGLRNKKIPVADSAPFHQTQNAEREGKKKQQLLRATASCKLSGTLLPPLSLCLPLSLLSRLLFNSGNTRPPRHVPNPFCLFPNIFKKITALGLMPRIYSLYPPCSSIRFSFLFPPSSFPWKLPR